ncbi:unnamed protein product [Diabrotica balteata]|uniref:Tc1-like transposase DDE domain-containing protein n=1 Tax=Diabrotica balteata TaxID=107213 RepID=A0A9N9XKH6_DIABA|nr:unnamed protein product [Diabrotica balteata]
MMNSKKYKVMLEQRLAIELDKVQVVGTEIFQQDSAPCQVSKVIMKYFKDNNITLLDWSGNSPDLNPIENFWAICKVKL